MQKSETLFVYFLGIFFLLVSKICLLFNEQTIFILFFNFVPYCS